MPRLINNAMRALAERHRALRRSLNQRAGRRAHAARGTAAARDTLPGREHQHEHKRVRITPGWWIALLGGAGALAGAALIAGHAHHLGESTVVTADAAFASHAAALFQPVLPGAVFDIPAQPGASLSMITGGALLSIAGMRAAAPVRVDLCSQLRDGARLLPLRLGYRFADVQRWVGLKNAAAPVALRNVLLVADGAPPLEAMPEVQISGMARPDFADPHSEPLQLSWRSPHGQARWLSDASLGQIEQGAAGTVAFRRQGWLLWGAAALRVERRPSAACRQAGELLIQVYRLAPTAATANADAAASGAKALVIAFPARGPALSAWLPPGRYSVPAAARAALEDQALFGALQSHGLVRLTGGGTIALAPRDLPLWLATPAAGRAAELALWQDVKLDAGGIALLKRLYLQADGAYVRQQVDIYNGERRLLAWRVKGGAAWQANVGASPVAATAQMPVAAARLFAELPLGWQPWSRVAHWPQSQSQSPADRGQAARLTLAVNGAGAPLELLVAGRVLAVGGARVGASPACSGRACAAPDDVQHLTLHPNPGTRVIEVEAQALDMTALGRSGDPQYRHLHVRDGRMVWQALNLAPAQQAAAAAQPKTVSPVQLRDRSGALLWADGAPTQPALDAGLAAMLGLGPEHANSISGMLARLPSASGAALTGKLALDLPLQALSQRVLECVGMRRGRWDGAACAGGQAAPAGRRAGLVILDTETGDVLAAAGAGAAPVTGANWSEVRDFDRVNPARSPLRLPALQHDGGAHQSPGSTFKVVSALGLELAARGDPQIDALLGGMPLAAINEVARRRGFGFETGAATYPMNPRLAHITNYKEQGLDRRAQEGRLGLAQALTYSLNTWFAWSGELSDRSLFGRPDGGAPDLQALEAGALDPVRPIVAAAHRLGFEQTLRLDGGLLPEDFSWSAYDALQATPARFDPIHTRHELRQMAIGLRMQVTPLQMALASAAIGQGRVVAPRLLLALDGRDSRPAPAPALDVRLDRIRAGMKGVVDSGTAAGAFGGAALAPLRRGLYGKTGTAPVSERAATVWFTGWLEPGSLPGQAHRLAMAVYISHSDATGGAHAAPVLAALLSTLAAPNVEQKGK